MANHSSRREFLKTSALGLAATAGAGNLTAAFAQNPPSGNISIWVTSADKKFAADSPIQWRPATGALGSDAIQLDPSKRFQEILGFGGAFTDATCYMFNQLTPPGR